MMNNNQPISLSDFLIRVGLWGGLGYIAGLRGSSLKNLTFLGPISEQVFGYSLEDIAAALEKERNLADKIRLREMGAIEMDKAFDNETFDKIVGTLVFSEFYSDEQRYVLGQAYRILRPGGLIIIADELRSNSLSKRILQLLVRIPLTVIAYILMQTATKALKDVSRLLTNAGFEIVHEKRSLLDSFGLYVAKKAN